MATSAVAVCQICYYVSPSLKIHISHLRLVHQGDSSFNLVCDIGGCRQQFGAFDAFNSYVYCTHRQALGQESNYSLQEPSASDCPPAPSSSDQDSNDIDESLVDNFVHDQFIERASGITPHGAEVTYLRAKKSAKFLLPSSCRETSFSGSRYRCYC